MIDNIGSTYQSLQGIQANRTFQAAASKGSGSVFSNALAAEMDDNAASFTPSAPAIDPATTPRALATSTLNQLQTTLQPLIHDVRQVAQSTGYLDVSAQDVMRAYQTGGSFLADYTV